MIQLRILGPLELRDSAGGDLTAELKGAKRLALLAYLATAEPGKAHRRDTLLALFWPESSERRARGSLRNTLHYLRSVLGPETIENVRTDQVRVAPDRLWCDAAAFKVASQEGDLTTALELYRGGLLPGLFISGAPEFEDWLSRERYTFCRAAADAGWRLAAEAEERGDTRAASRYAHFVANLDPFDEQSLRKIIELRDRLGDRAGALSIYRSLAERMEAEMLGEPAPETTALIERISSRRHLHEPAPPSESPAPSSEESGQNPPASPPPEDPGPPLPPTSEIEPPQNLERRRRLGLQTLGIAAALVVLIAALASWPWDDTADGWETVISLTIDDIETYGADTKAEVSAILPSLLSASLARAPEIRVISRAHLLDLTEKTGAGPTIDRAARDAGVNELLKGVLIEREHELRLELRRIDLATGRVTAAYSVNSGDPFDLIDQITEQLLGDYGLNLPATGIAEVSTYSTIAYRFYEEGVRAYVDGDNRTAGRLLATALAEDPGFAMAAYYKALTYRNTDHRAFRDGLFQAAQLADNATDLERLRIRAAWAQAMDEPAQRIYADSLVEIYPNQPDGYLFLGKALLWGGEFLEAISHLHRVIHLDSLSLYGTQVSCDACDAIADLITAYLLADSLAAAEVMARRWTEIQPNSAKTWHALGSSLEYQGKTDEAQAARDRAAALRTDNPRDPLFPAVLALRRGDFDEAERELVGLDRPGTSLVQQNVLWYRTLKLRLEGRPSEALPVARQYSEALRQAEATGHSTTWPEVLEALALSEMGEHHDAAALWEKMAESNFDPESPARSARHRAWTLTHAASALAPTGEIERLSELAAEIEELGSQSAYGRDPKLHYYVRGLIEMNQGDTARAVDLFREAVFSTTNGYARINLELGRGLLALGNPHEAAEIAGAALRGPLDAGNLYASRTELHELAGLAWERAGEPDSAAVHYRWVIKSWQRAEEPYLTRRREIAARLEALEHQIL